MKNVVIVTDIAFWRRAAGHAARLYAIVQYLSPHTSLTVVYGGIQYESDLQLLQAHSSEVEVIFLNKHQVLQPDEYAQLFQQYLRENPVQVCIVEYIYLSFLLPYIPQDITVILDTHDIISERSESFKKYPYQTRSYELSEHEEYQLFRKYDYVMLINDVDYQKVSQTIGKEKALLAPHPVVPTPKVTREVALNVGYVASEYIPNVDAISYFMREIWPDVITSCTVHQELGLHIYGNITKVVNFESAPRTFSKGYIPNLQTIYKELDIAINPVRFGAGLKIKNVEALGNGVPLITTSHGARGMESGAGRAFAFADDAKSFSQALIRLITNYEERKRLSECAIEFTQLNFSPKSCFSTLLAVINST